MLSNEQSTFYDQHPFDWVPPGTREEIREVVSRSLVDLIKHLDPRSLILDIGCGPGRVLGLMAQEGMRCIGLDRSRVSIGLAVERYGRPGVVGDNLHLPFPTAIADVVISDGVIHHTGDPQAAFAENCRVLKPGGKMYLGVYKPSGRYPFLYEYPGGLIRQGLRHDWSRLLVVLFAQVPYFLIHFLRSRGKRTWNGARNLFYDYFVTPHVAFLSRELVEDWCKPLGISVVRYDSNRGQNVHSFILEKEALPSPERDLAIASASEIMATGKRENA
jgi:SAM-dependent methyltransferase